MLKAREILRLKHEIGLSLREIGQACNCGNQQYRRFLREPKRQEYHGQSTLMTNN